MKKLLIYFTTLLITVVICSGQTCSNGKVHTTCGTMCPLTCANKDNPPMICPLACKVGCVCPSGMVEYNEGCVTPDQCPNITAQPVCTNGNVYQSCGSSCPLTCANKDNPPSCIQECVEGCFCPSAMVSNEGNCVLPDNCPTISVDPCQLPSDSGLCEAYFPSFFYNSSSNQCQSFVYGGCGGNANRFETVQSCMESCGPSNFGNPYVTPPVSCPDFNESLLGACVITSECTNVAVGNSGGCSDGNLCCSTGCGGMLCNEGITPSPLCAAVRSKALNESDGLLGVYIPLCENDGTFSHTQCHEGMCWCVDTETGKALAEAVGPGESPQCTQECTNSKVYSSCGTMCPLTCANKDNPPMICPLACKVGCVCPSGMVEYNEGCVTPDHCPNTTVKPVHCQSPSDSGHCKGNFPSFFYNSSSNQCQSFVYGGCGGNANRFETMESCMETCGDNETASTDSPSPVLVVDAFYNAQKLCPATDGDDVVCGDHCSADSDCEDWEKCCSSGCGHSCMETVDVPYYSPPKQCPQPILPICNFHFACSSHDSCDDDNYCCSTGCGDMCMSGIEPTPLCLTVKDSAQSSGALGAYIPQCDENGNFSSVQCHGSTGMCWCVDTKTGKPLTTPVMAEQPECDKMSDDKCKGIQCDWPFCGEDIQPLMDDDHCCPYCPADCTVGDMVYSSGTSFKSSDGCNTCNCYNGMAACTEMACVSTCNAGGILMAEGETRSDGCSECVCKGGKMSCSLIENGCTNPVSRSVDVTMKFDGNFDIVLQDLEGFKLFFKTSLVNKYKSLDLHESQITNLDVYRGSVMVVVTLEDSDSDDTQSANITHVVIQLQQDYNSNDLTVYYQGMMLKPTGDFSYEDNDNNEGFFFGTCVVISSILVVLVVISIVTLVGVIILMKRSRKTNRIRIPSKDIEDFEDYEMDGKVKGSMNPTSKSTHAL